MLGRRGVEQHAGQGTVGDDVTEAVVTVDVVRDVRLRLERPVGTAGDRHVVEPDEPQHVPDVAQGVVDDAVAVDGRDADDLDVGLPGEPEQGERVVDARVGVDQHAARPAGARHAGARHDAVALPAFGPHFASTAVSTKVVIV